MDKSSLKIILSVLGGYFISFVFMLSFSFVTFPSLRILRIYLLSWVFDNAAGLFMETLIPVTATVFLLTFSLILSPQEAGAKRSGDVNFFRLVRNTFFILMGLLFFYTIGMELIIPGLQRSQENRAYRSSLALNFLDKSSAAKGLGDFRQAREYLSDYLRINPADDAAEELFDEISERVVSVEPEEPAPEKAEKTVRMMNDKNASDLISRGCRISRAGRLFFGPLLCGPGGTDRPFQEGTRAYHGSRMGEDIPDE